MSIQKFSVAMQQRFNEIYATGMLFKSKISGDELWNCYLNSFEDGMDVKFRDPESSEHNCNNCKSFLRRYGNIVGINEKFEIITMFGGLKLDREYQAVADAMDALLKSKGIEEVFVETIYNIKDIGYGQAKAASGNYLLGTPSNYKRYTAAEAAKFGVVKANQVVEFNHFYLNIPKEFINKFSGSVESNQAKFRDKMNVFKRAIQEIPLDLMETAKDLIEQGSLLDGTAHLASLESMIRLKKESAKISSGKIDNWCWAKTYTMHDAQAKFRNHLIGTFCVDLGEKGIAKSCKDWNVRVDPVNYHKAAAPISKRQIQEAEQFVIDNGYAESFNRRFATLDDIAVEEIRHINEKDEKIAGVSVFQNVKSNASKGIKLDKNNLQDISIEDFLKDVLPGAKGLEVLLENKHASNMAVMTTAVNPESKSILKWNNPFALTFNGNLAGKSQIRDAVKSRGGATDGVLNVRLAFPGTNDDYDLHMFEPYGNHINYLNVRERQSSSGVLDLDAQGVDGHQDPEKRVENITYSNLAAMPDGDYVVKVNDFSRKGFKADFFIEIETADGMLSLTYKQGTSRGNTVNVAVITKQGDKFTVVPSEDMQIGESTTISKEIWGLNSNEFHGVSLMCLSPNHWGDNAVGNKYYMFMLKGCRTDKAVRTFHNEQLNNELLKHRKVMEVVGASNQIKPASEQLAGLGFNSTVRDEVVVRVSGKRMYNVKF